MKNFTLIILFYCSINLFGQDLTNKYWTKFHIERLDGSRIISRTNIVESPLNYHFHNNGKVSIITVLGETEIEYSIKDSIIAIGSNQLYQIELLTDTLLVLIELPEYPKEADKINRIYFSPEEQYANNIISMNLVQFINDSTIISSRYLRPHFTGGSLDQYLYDELSSSNLKNTELKGSFMITPTGQIRDILCENYVNINNEIKERILDLLMKTNYRWRTPYTKAQYYYMVNFSILFKDSFIVFAYYESNESDSFPNLSARDQDRAGFFFQEGNRLLSRGNYEKAISNYAKCIEIDEIFLDAYYNRAYANIMLGNDNESCIDWGILSELGQTEAIKLFNQHCKNDEN